MLGVSEAGAQWKKLAQFSEVPACIYLLDSGKSSSYTAFVGGNSLNFIPSEYTSVWRTINGGKNWEKVFSSPDLYYGNITSFSFKDSLTGWFSSGDYDDPGDASGGCYRTRDGGNSWESLIPNTESQNGWCVYYNPSTKLLHYSRTGNHALYSSDEGTTWKKYGILPRTYYNWTGYCFLDSLNGIVGTVTTILQPNTKFYNYYRSSDGGQTWRPLMLNLATWQPAFFHHSLYAVVQGDYWIPSDSTILYKSVDTGTTWLPIHLFYPTFFVPTLQTDSSNLFVQSGIPWVTSVNKQDRNSGIFTSSDDGLNWKYLCGPENFAHSTFVANNYGIWAGSFDGGLWYNRTKKPNADRLQIEKDNLSRHQAYIGEDIPIALYYPYEAYYEGVDSLSFVINISESLGFVSDSVADGWRLLRRETTDSTIRFIVQRTTATAPDTSSFILKAYFKAFVTRAKTATLTLDEINFNQDTTFRECMVASLKRTDSIFIDLVDNCGDSLLRTFITSHGNLRIISLTPNPTTDNITVDVESPELQQVQIEIVNAVGITVVSKSQQLKSGSNVILINTQNLPSGLYFLRVRGLYSTVNATFQRI